MVNSRPSAQLTKRQVQRALITQALANALQFNARAEH
jgi:hypothetical protein